MLPSPDNARFSRPVFAVSRLPCPSLISRGGEITYKKLYAGEKNQAISVFFS